MALDLNMGYYTIRLDPDASRICTIIFSWGKYSYKLLPMGIAGSPDIFQNKMLEVMETLEYVQAYLDDLSQLRSNIRLFDYRCLFPIIYDWVSHVKLNIHAPEMN